MFSFVEENYLKAIYHLSDHGRKSVSTNALAEEMQTTAASVSDMMAKLSKKKAVDYQKYKGVNVSGKGKEVALRVIRKHRLWEVFLVDQLKFHWDEVHEIAENSSISNPPILISRLDEFLGFPKHDPHGDPIPDENGVFSTVKKVSLTELALNAPAQVVAVNDSSGSFLKYLDKVGISIGTKIKVEDTNEFDGSLDITIDQKKSLTISQTAAQNILVANT